MKWLIIKLIVWWHYRIWSREVKLVDETGKGYLSPAALLQIWDNAPCTQLIKIVPRAYYTESDVATVTTDIGDLRLWLEEYLLTIKRYNALTPDELLARPENTYLNIKDVIISDRKITELDLYMRNHNGAIVTHKYLVGVMDLVRTIDEELSCVEDPYEYNYFLRRAGEVMLDVWQIHKTLVEASRHYEPEETKG